MGIWKHVCVNMWGCEYLNVCMKVYVYLCMNIFVSPSFILQDGSAVPNSFSSATSSPIDLLPGLDTILEELLQEDGYVPITVWSI